jgi:hypothetical protein
MSDNTKRTHCGIEHISKKERERSMRGRQGKPEHQRRRRTTK